jgi:hypothetical protein
VALAPFPLRATRHDSALFIVIASGLGFAATNIAAKLTTDDLGARTYWNAAAWSLVALVGGIAATITNMTGFQRRRATMVVPVITAVQTYVPILLEPLFLHESWSTAPFDGVPIVLGVVLAATGTTLVARTTAVGEMSSAAASRADHANLDTHRRKKPRRHARPDRRSATPG